MAKYILCTKTRLYKTDKSQYLNLRTKYCALRKLLIKILGIVYCISYEKSY